MMALTRVKNYPSSFSLSLVAALLLNAACMPSWSQEQIVADKQWRAVDCTELGVGKANLATLYDDGRMQITVSFENCSDGFEYSKDVELKIIESHLARYLLHFGSPYAHFKKNGRTESVTSSVDIEAREYLEITKNDEWAIRVAKRERATFGLESDRYFGTQTFFKETPWCSTLGVLKPSKSSFHKRGDRPDAMWDFEPLYNQICHENFN